MYSHRSRKAWAASGAVLLLVAACGQGVEMGSGTGARVVVESAEVRPVLRLEPRSGAPGKLVLVRSDSCPPPSGADFYSMNVRVHRPGASWDQQALAYAMLVRTLADWPDVQRFSVAATPSYGAVPDGAAALRDDGSWVAPVWVPYRTPAGEYVVRAKCFASFSGPDAEWRLLADYAPAPLVVEAWPPVPPTYTACAAPGGLFVDGPGDLHVWGWRAPLGGYELTGQDGGWWPGRDLARGIAFESSISTGGYLGGGLVIDAFGGMHQFREPYFGEGLAQPRGSPYWPGWDIARGVAVQQHGEDASTEGLDGWGVVLDGWGGLHPFTLGSGPPITITAGTGPYWPGWDIARDVALLPGGDGGYVLDGWGGLHPFGLHGNPAPPKPRWQPYWPGWDIARGVMLVDHRSGYVVDAFGGTHSFSIDGAYQPGPPPTPYWPGQYVVRGAALIGCSY